MQAKAKKHLVDKQMWMMIISLPRLQIEDHHFRFFGLVVLSFDIDYLPIGDNFLLHFYPTKTT